MSEIQEIALNKICELLNVDPAIHGEDTAYILLLASARINRLQDDNNRLQGLLNEANKQAWNDRM